MASAMQANWGLGGTLWVVCDCGETVTFEVDDLRSVSAETCCCGCREPYGFDADGARAVVATEQLGGDSYRLLPRALPHLSRFSAGYVLRERAA